jgi:hypothetical protein
MSLTQELPIYKATYDLLLAIFNFTKEFTKEYKYTVGEQLKLETMKLLTLIYRANARRDKLEIIRTAQEQIEIIRLYIRVMKDMKQISLKKFVGVNQKVENVSKQLTGWKNSFI